MNEKNGKKAVSKVDRGIYDVTPLETDGAYTDGYTDDDGYYYADEYYPEDYYYDEEYSDEQQGDYYPEDEKPVNYGFTPSDKEAPAKSEDSTFVPVTNPLKVALDNGKLDLAELTEEEEQELFMSQNPGMRRAAKRGKGFFSSFDKGDSPFVLITSLVNLGFFTVWTVAYIICVACREIFMSQAINEMLALGQTFFEIEITSPVFTLLKVFLFVLPVMMIVWAVGISKANKNNIELCDRTIILGAFGVDVLVGIVALLDTFVIHLMFE